MATEYQYIDYTMTPIYSSTSGIASPPSIITKDNSMDMANPSVSKKLYLSNQDSPYYNPNFMNRNPNHVRFYTICLTITLPIKASDDGHTTYSMDIHYDGSCDIRTTTITT